MGVGVGSVLAHVDPGSRIEDLGSEHKGPTHDLQESGHLDMTAMIVEGIRPKIYNISRFSIKCVFTTVQPGALLTFNRRRILATIWFLLPLPCKGCDCTTAHAGVGGVGNNCENEKKTNKQQHQRDCNATGGFCSVYGSLEKCHTSPTATNRRGRNCYPESGLPDPIQDPRLLFGAGSKMKQSS